MFIRLLWNALAFRRKHFPRRNFHRAISITINNMQTANNARMHFLPKHAPQIEIKPRKQRVCNGGSKDQNARRKKRNHFFFYRVPNLWMPSTFNALSNRAWPFNKHVDFAMQKRAHNGISSVSTRLNNVPFVHLIICLWPPSPPRSRTGITSLHAYLDLNNNTIKVVFIRTKEKISYSSLLTCIMCHPLTRTSVIMHCN